MTDLGLDTHSLATAMGKAYAIMHWGAGINGDDVEFVLGTSLLLTEGTNSHRDVQNRAVGMYLLDFGQCNAVNLQEDPDIVYQAFKGTMVTDNNQSYIPNCRTSPALFQSFRDGYLQAGRVVLEQKGLEERFSIEEFLGQYDEYSEDFL